MMGNGGLQAHRSHAFLRLIVLAYTAFVIYGSLVPLEYRALPWDEAVARFQAMPFLKLGIGSRADWVANLLLFIPLTFLWLAALAPKTRFVRAGVALSVIPAATLLSLGIEFTQLFFPQRTVSQNDIFAETLGGGLGVLAWLAFGSRFVAWLNEWQHTHTRAALGERLAWVYLAGVLVYNVLPLDLTLSLVEIFHKWRDGRIVLVPFSRLPDGAAYALYEVATDALIWTPLALLWRLNQARSAERVFVMTLATAAVLELMQIFVVSRVSDVTDLFTGAAGAAFGILLGALVAGRPLPRADSPRRVAAEWLPLVLIAAWVALLMFVFWFPFDFQTDGALIKSRLGSAVRVPFEVYYFGTEYRAITEVLRKMLFFAPLGGLLAWAVVRQPWRWRRPLFVMGMLLMAALPAVIELGQALLPHKIVDATDWMLAWLGSLAGYAVARRGITAPRHAVAVPSPASPAVQATHAVNPRLAWHWHFPLAGAAMTLLFLAVMNAPFVPYNVRELFGENSPWLSSLLLALTCYWLAVWPVWLARRPVSRVARLWQVPLGLLTYGAVAFLLLQAAVPDESLHDLVGSPVLNWSWQWETALRWIALTAIPGAASYLAVQSLRRWRGRRLGTMHFVAAIPVLLLAYWGVMIQAATDNLTELVATPKPFAFAVLCVWLYTLFIAAAALASPLAQRSLRWVILITSLPLAMLCLHLGLAGEIEKYGQQFSALQFLLSTDRQHYAAMPHIWLRYVALHVLVIAVLAFLQWPHLRSAARPRVPAHVSH